MQWERVPDDTPTTTPQPRSAAAQVAEPAPKRTDSGSDPDKGKLVGVAVTAGLGILMILFGDFGGWYSVQAQWDASRNSYQYTGSSGTVHLFSSPFAFLFLSLAIAGLVLAGLAAMARLGWAPLRPGRLDRAGFLGGAASAGLAVVGVIGFFVRAWEAEDVWLDTAFYGAFGAGALTAGLLWAAGALDEDKPTT